MGTAEPRRNGFDLWSYQDDTPEIVYLGSGANEEQLEALADQFLLGDPEIMNPPFFLKGASGTLSQTELIESNRRSAPQLLDETRVRDTIQIAVRVNPKSSGANPSKGSGSVCFGDQLR